MLSCFSSTTNCYFHMWMWDLLLSRNLWKICNPFDKSILHNNIPLLYGSLRCVHNQPHHFSRVCMLPSHCLPKSFNESFAQRFPAFLWLRKYLLFGNRGLTQPCDPLARAPTGDPTCMSTCDIYPFLQGIPHPSWNQTIITFNP